jgi:hypothetical protein
MLTSTIIDPVEGGYNAVAQEVLHAKDLTKKHGGVMYLRLGQICGGGGAPAALEQRFNGAGTPAAEEGPGTPAAVGTPAVTAPAIGLLRCRWGLLRGKKGQGGGTPAVTVAATGLLRRRRGLMR